MNPSEKMNPASPPPTKTNPPPTTATPPITSQQLHQFIAADRSDTNNPNQLSALERFFEYCRSGSLAPSHFFTKKGSTTPQPRSTSQKISLKAYNEKSANQSFAPSSSPPPPQHGAGAQHPTPPPSQHGANAHHTSPSLPHRHGADAHHFSSPPPPPQGLHHGADAQYPSPLPPHHGAYAHHPSLPLLLPLPAAPPHQSPHGHPAAAPFSLALATAARFPHLTPAQWAGWSHLTSSMSPTPTGPFAIPLFCETQEWMTIYFYDGPYEAYPTSIYGIPPPHPSTSTAPTPSEASDRIEFAHLLELLAPCQTPPPPPKYCVKIRTGKWLAGVEGYTTPCNLPVVIRRDAEEEVNGPWYYVVKMVVENGRSGELVHGNGRPGVLDGRRRQDREVLATLSVAFYVGCEEPAWATILQALRSGGQWVARN